MYASISSKYEIKASDIELVGNSLRGTLKDPDLVSNENFEKIIYITEIIGSAPIYAHFPVTASVREIYLDAMSTVIYKLHHSAAVKRALPEAFALANGLSISA